MTPAIRVLNGRSCGTATHIYRDGRYSYWLTNAHVAGTKIGQLVRLERYDTETTRYDARVVAAAYSRNGTTDVAVLRSEAVSDMAYVRIAADVPAKLRGQHSGGHPKCSPTVWKHRYPSRRTGQTEYSTPNSIGGESGSGIVDNVRNAIVGLLTWSANGYCLAQRSDHIHRVLSTRIVDHEPVPQSAVPACDFPQECASGVFGHTNDLPAGMFTTLADAPLHPGTEINDEEPDVAPPAANDPDSDCECNDDDRTEALDFDWDNVVRVLEVLLMLLANLTSDEGEELKRRVKRTMS